MAHKLIKGKNDLYSQHKGLMKLWDYNRNNDNPADILAGTSKKYWWVCDLGHSWEKSPSDMIRITSSCPFCSGKKAWKGFNDLESLYPEIAEFFDSYKNNITPDSVVYTNTSTKFWWKCSNGNNHSYPATVVKRLKSDQCTVCTGRFVIEGVNDLLSQKPRIAQEWNYEKNSKNPSEVSYKQSSKVFWICKNGHEWENSVRNRTINGQNCPYCVGTKITPEKSLFSVHPEFLKYWSASLNPDIDKESLACFSKKKIIWVCDKNSDHTWTRTAEKMHTGTGKCPICSKAWNAEIKNDLVDNYPHIAKEYSSKNEIPLEDIRSGSSRVVIWECEKGHEWETTPQSRTTNNYKCPYCSGYKVIPNETSIFKTHGSFLQEWDYEKNDIKPQEISYGSHKKVWWKCSDCNYSWNQTPYQRIKRRNGCPRCSGRVAHTGKNDIATLYPEVIDFWSDKNTLSPNKVKPGSGLEILWTCQQGHEWSLAPYVQLQNSIEFFCPRCRDSHTSQMEKEVYQYVVSLFDSHEDVMSNTRSIIAPYELDIYIPSKNIAIEFNGLYYHNEDKKDKNYHYNKWKMCDYLGIQLITIWEDEWLYKQEIVKSMLSYKLHKYNGDKQYARKTVLQEIDHVQASEFLEKYHIQGFTRGSIYLGSFNTDEQLCAVSCWVKNGNDLILQRYATSIPVVGGMGKHLSYGIEYCIENDIDTISTFADHCVSNGGLYENLGFVPEKELPPDYKYIYKRERIHKFNFRKKRFKSDRNLYYDNALTERELAHINGIKRIYDCGKTKYVYYV